MAGIDLSHLNEPQREAVTHGSGPLLVLAGAGSGKTRVITQRIAYLIAQGIPAKAIAALTFTNKAAGEMRERVAALIGNPKIASQLTMGTFHSLGLAMLKAERKALGYPSGFVIYDTADQLGVVREILRRVDDGGRRYDVKAILTRISLAKNALIGPEDYTPNPGDEYDDITAEVYPKYCEEMRAYAALDFDDLIVAPVRIFGQNEEVRAKWADKFHHVMVDEYQDTNRTQLELVKHLVVNHGNLCVVGDDDQSIYSWRGADPTNILNFDQMFAGARVVKLEQNYRSTRTILDAANAVIANNTQRHGKTLWSELGKGESIVHAVAMDIAAEAKFVAQEIAREREAQGRRFSDFAVLYRSNLQARLIEEELRVLQVPYAMFGGQQFFERKEVKDVIAYLRVALSDRDEIALRRIINFPARGIGPTTLDKAAAVARKTLWDGVLAVRDDEEVRGGTRTAIADFVDIIEGIQERIAGGGIEASVRYLIEKIDLYSDIRTGSPNMTAAQRRIDNVESLIKSLIRSQERKPGKAALSDYLRQLSLAAEEEERPDGDRVTLTTLHGAKGLEFPVVFIIGWEEEIMPHARSLTVHATDVGDPDHVSDVSEERRLAYVGITRAQRKLYLTRSVTRMVRGKPLVRTPSRFLLEIPEELFDVRDLAEEAAAVAPADEVKSFFANFQFD